MEYLVYGITYSFSYKELKREHERFCNMLDEEFLANLPAAAHLACIICYLKECNRDETLGDKGIIHELIHLMHIPDQTTTRLKQIRSEYERILKLA